MKCRLIRTLTGYTPADAEAQKVANRHKPGQVVVADVVVPRNNKFMRKYFALLKLGFEYWEPEDGKARTYKGHTIEKNFERFRGDVAILAGFYEATWNINGELRLEPKSISFANMEEDEFEQLYSKSIQVLLDKVLAAKGFTPAEIDRAVDELLRFD